MEPVAPDEYDNPPPRHTWRHVRTAVTLLVLVGFVVGAAWYSWNVVAADGDDSDATPQPTCLPVAATDAPSPDDIELNVYNGTQRGGLARDVAASLRDRGFTITDVANDPQDSTVEGVAVVRSHPEQQRAVSLVQVIVPGAEFQPDERNDETVDLVLGEAFDELAAMPDPDETLNPCT